MTKATFKTKHLTYSIRARARVQDHHGGDHGNKKAVLMLLQQLRVQVILCKQNTERSLMEMTQSFETSQLIPNYSAPPTTVPQTRDQVFQHMSMCGLCSFKPSHIFKNILEANLMQLFSMMSLGKKFQTDQCMSNRYVYANIYA